MGAFGDCDCCFRGSFCVEHKSCEWVGVGEVEEGNDVLVERFVLFNVVPDGTSFYFVETIGDVVTNNVNAENS